MKILIPGFFISVAIMFALPVAAQFNCGDSLTDLRDGKKYSTVQIGNQCWMAQNLNYGTMISSSAPGALMQNNGIVEKYCWNNDPDYCNGTNGKPKWGGFYEWQEAVQNYVSQPSLPVQGVCPDGWHIPSRAEYNQMVSSLGGTTSAGTAVQPGGSSGFNGILTGYRCTMNGSFLNSPTGGTKIAYYWTSQQSDATNAYFYEIAQSYASFGNGIYSPFLKSLGLSLRCIMDVNVNVGDIIPPDLFDVKIKSAMNNMITLDYSASVSSKGTVMVYDITGKKVAEEHREFEPGNGRLEIHLPNPATGVLIVNVTTASTNKSIKVCIVN